MTIPLLARTGLLALVCFIASCAEIQQEPLPEPLRGPRVEAATAEETNSQVMNSSSELQNGRFQSVPKAKITRSTAKGAADKLGLDLTGEPISLAFNDVPLVAFINEVFGNELKMSYVISPALQGRNDLVTLRMNAPQSPAELFQTVRTVLEQYGVGITQENGLLNFVASKDVLSTEVPLLVSGRTLPDVPSSHRTIFQLVQLKTVRNPQVSSLLKQAFKGRDLTLIEDPDRNAVVLKGTPELVQQGLGMIEVLDQPVLKGQYSVLVQPQYLSAKELADSLNKVLRSQGYEPSLTPPQGSIILLPLEESNKLLVFAADRATIEHVKSWVTILDDQERDGIKDGIFTYEVQNVQAENLVGTLNQLLGGQTSGSKAGGGAAGVARASETGLVVDKNRNLLIYKGAGSEWAQIAEVVKELDRPTPSVLIEVLLAEVTLSDEYGSGIDFFFKGKAGRYGLTGGTEDALNLAKDGLNLVLDSAGATRATLNAFYSDNKVNIRSSPKLLVKSGGEATIEVGNEIPVITQNSQSSTTTNGNSDILQEITYRKTGVIMEIKPIVQANGLVDIEISQELSEARPTDGASLAGSPTILNRTVKTELTLKDGGSLLMGGIISNSQSANDQGIPGLGKIPLIGRLFKSDSYQNDRTELMILIIPYVIRNEAEGLEITEQFKNSLELHEGLKK